MPNQEIFPPNLYDVLGIFRELRLNLTDEGHLPAPQASISSWRDREALLDIIAAQPASYAAQREQMLSAIRANILDRASIDLAALDRVLAAMGDVPREAFMHEAAKPLAYLPSAFALGHGQTISDPHIVAVMLLALDLPPDARVLDIGTGSGYQAAVLSRLTKTVVSLEIIPQLAESAAARLSQLGYHNVAVTIGDGASGAPDQSPFDAIIVAAAAASVPPKLLDQLKVGGRLVIPIGQTQEVEQLLVNVKVSDKTIISASLGSVRFVPLTGAGGRNVSANDTASTGAELPFLYGAAIT